MSTERVVVLPKLELGTLKRFAWYFVIVVFALLLARSLSRSEYGAARQRAKEADDRMNAEGRYLHAWEKAVKEQPELAP